MARYQVILAYDGTEFLGFQRQASSKQRTVQVVVETALRRLGWQGQTLLVAGRTDTGVHATGQVIAFDLDWGHPPEALRAALNANLPPDVAAQEVRLAADDFHPRYAARSRRYRYALFCHPLRDPLGEHFAWRVWPPVDGERLRQAAAALVGTYDFGAFGSPPRAEGTTVRTVFQAAWLPIAYQAAPPGSAMTGWVFEISGNAFLYHMVRRLVGFQVAIGQGFYPPEALVEHLEQPVGEMVKTVAPPHGLTLVEVVYEDGFVEQS